MSYEKTHNPEEIKLTVERGLQLYDNISDEEMQYLEERNLVHRYFLDDKLQLFLDDLPNGRTPKKITCISLDYILTKEIKDYVASCIYHRLEMELKQYADFLSNKLDLYTIDDEEKATYLKAEKDAIFSRFNTLDFATNSPTELVEFYLSDNIEFVDINAFIINDKALKIQFWNRLSKLDWVIDNLECNLMKMQIKHINKLLSELKTPKTKDSLDNSAKQSISFNSLFKNKKDKQFTLDALEDLSLTREGKSILTDRKKSALKGFVEALKEATIIPNHNTDTLCELFATQIAMPYKARLKATDTSNATYKAMKKHIKEHY